LASYPSLQIQQEQVNISRGLLRLASAPFDPVTSAGFSSHRQYTPLASYQRFSPDIDSSINNTAIWNVAATKLLRNGISLGPNVELDRITDNISQRKGVNTSRMGFQVTIPLLRGRGAPVVAAGEIAARNELSATLLDLNHLVAEVLSVAALSYWNFLAAARNVSVAVQAEERGKALAESTRLLIEGDRTPRSDLLNTMANLSDRRAALIFAEAQLTTARQQLALRTGLDPATIPGSSMPIDDFPDTSRPGITLPTGSVDAWIRSATLHRADLLAAQQRETEQRVLQVQAKDGFRPQLDLSLNFSSSGLHEGRQPQQSLAALGTGVEGLNAGFSLVYRFPRRWDDATGRAMVAQASVRQSELHSEDLKRTIASAVVVAYENMRTALLQIAQAREAVDSYSRSLEAEREKLRVGVGSIINVFTVEDRWNAAFKTLIAAQAEYASSVAQFRLATGTLIVARQSVQQIDADLFLRPPAGIPE
jgi:outer membrane protein TolC